MVNTSLIKEIDKESIEEIILFKHLNEKDADFLKESFSFENKDMKNILEGYRDIGLLINLKKETDSISFDWSPFINRVIIKNDIVGRLDNVFINKDFAKILLITTKRLLKIDLKKLNEKINSINDAIRRYDVKIQREKKEIEHELSGIDKII